MYFHPLVPTEAQVKQVSAAAKDFARPWLEGMDRQRRLHANALSRTLFEPKWGGDSQHDDVTDNRSTHHRQVMA